MKCSKCNGEGLELKEDGFVNPNKICPVCNGFGNGESTDEFVEETILEVEPVEELIEEVEEVEEEQEVVEPVKTKKAKKK